LIRAGNKKKIANRSRGSPKGEPFADRSEPDRTGDQGRYADGSRSHVLDASNPHPRQMAARHQPVESSQCTNVRGHLQLILWVTFYGRLTQTVLHRDHDAGVKSGEAREGPTHMWWLTFLGGGVVIVEAASLAHARLLATMKDLGHPSHFAEGHAISPDLAAMIPDDCVGRMLSPNKVQELHELVRHGTRKYVANRSQHPEKMSPRRRA